jgi:hypothetical protein
MLFGLDFNLTLKAFFKNPLLLREIGYLGITILFSIGDYSLLAF